MFKHIKIASLPLLILCLYSLIGCFIGYGLFLGLDGAVELRRLISKSTQILLILSIYPCMRWLNHKAKDLGFIPIKAFIQQMGLGIILGAFSLFPILYLSYALDITLFNNAITWTLEQALGNLLVSFLLALLISFLEEPMFRGILITAYIKRIGLGAAILISSFYYAILHFIKTKSSISIENVQFSDTFSLLYEAFANLFNPVHLGALWALLMVGIFLAVMRTHLKLSLAWCIGCHAAWVWQIKMAHHLVVVNPESDLIFLVSPYDGVIGPMVALWLSLLIALYFIYKHYSQRTIAL
jgi:membrane protease YdiL (CAAX protease family)